ncbi:MAG: hypothetical protein JO166_20910 [Deltaproteobacteria bacterium]|nr:hypothetical protein [Deltaproteobacteria bacterium]
MRPGKNAYSFMVLGLLSTAIVLIAYGLRWPALAQQSLSHNAAAHEGGALPAGMARLYVFREVRSFGAHIDDYVTIDGLPVHRVTPGTGFYCDLRPGNYVIGVARHKTYPLRLSVAAGQREYICVMLHTQGGVAPRGGALTADQPFDVRLLDPNYGKERVEEYRMTEAKCEP